MKLTWDSEAQAWVGDVSRAGPAGTSATTIAGIWVEFDRVDSGRIVSLLIPADRLALFGGTHPRLTPPPDDAEVVVEVDLTDTPLWLASRDLAQAAELAEDAHRLHQSGERNAAAVAYAELAEVLRALGDLAPLPPEPVLAQIPELMQGDRPLLEVSAVPRYDALMERNLAAASDALRERLLPVALADPWIRTATVPDREPVYAGERAPHRVHATNLLSQVRGANGLGREALRAEQTDAAGAARAWHRCATAWLDLGETGRAAIALDRAGDAASKADQPAEADQYRSRARDVAPLWALPALGNTGHPHRPLWSHAPTVPDLFRQDDLVDGPEPPDEPRRDGR